MGRVSTGLSKRLPQSNDYKAVPFASKQHSICEMDQPESKRLSGQLSVCN